MSKKFKSITLLGEQLLFGMMLTSCGASDLLEQERLLRMEAENTSSFLLGFLITGVVIALLTGVGIGSNARQESDRQREERGDNETRFS